MTPPPATTLVVIEKLIAAYKLWHEYIRTIPKIARFSLGEKTDTYFVGTFSHLIQASYAIKTDKLKFLREASLQLTLLKFFLRVLWEIHALDNKKFGKISEMLDEVGRLLGGWQRKVEYEQKAR